MAKILIDTSIIIDHLRLKNKKQTILTKIFLAGHDLFTSILTHTESYAGKSIWKNKDARTYLENILADMKILPLTEKLSIEAGQISAIYNLETVDAIIAATALFHKLELATLNVKDFEKIAGLKLKKT